MGATTSKELVTKHFDGSEFERASVLNEGVTLEDIEKQMKKTPVKTLKFHRSKSRRPKKY